ncbi:Tbc1d32 [Phodopus roborovskii]|uniref:Protein broad-minded n=1 Tax=Phodopus roborovskii TaxID=109678 RepID=A0AAU9YSI1_PHORO|nr:Tbc1d32 [Phodopus roborovskii]
MAGFSSDDEVMLQAMLRQLFQSVKEKITGAPSLECAEEILLRLEETDENFHNYEFVKYLRQHICNTLGSMIEEEMEKCTSDQNQGEESGYDTVVQDVTKRTQESKEYKEMMHSLKSIMMVVVESMINKSEEDDETRSQERQRILQEKRGSSCTGNCSDSDSSFNQSYKFCQGKLQLILDQLDPGQPKEVRYEALQTLCSAPPSDVLNCENWTTLCEKLTASLSDPDPMFTDRILKFYAQTFTLSPLHMTKEIYTSLAKYLELYFLSRENHIPTLSAGVDITSPNVIRLLKKVRLLNEYQKEVPSFWIRHPEKYMEEIVESTLSLLSVKHDQSHLASQKILDPIYFFALVDTKAVWFKKWMHAYYSRTTVLRLLEKKYKSLITTAVHQCVQYLELCEAVKADGILGHSKHCGNKQKNFYYSGQELQYIYFIHSLCLLGRLVIYTQGRKLFPIKLKNRKDSVSLTNLLVLFTQLIYHSPSCPKMTSVAYSENFSPASMVTDILRILCDQKECAVECLYNSTVTETLLQPIHNLMKGTEAAPHCSETALIHIADILARIASVEEGLILLLYGETMNSSEEESPTGAHIIARFSKKLLDEDLSIFSGSEMLPIVKGAFICVCRQIYSTCEGLQALLPYGLHESIAKAWRKTSLLSERIPTPVEGSDSVSSMSRESPTIMAWEDNLLDDLLNFAATPKGLLLLQRTGAINECVTFMFNQYAKKLQINRQKKFGYEVLVVQVASTAAGAVALQNSGFISALITELWSNLECGRDDVRVNHPKATPVDPIDRSCQKSFLALVNLLSYPAVYELTSHQELPNKAEYSLREVPTCIIDVIDRLIILNSEAKIRSLLNYEQSHIFGLRDFIIDGLSVERNHVLVRINLIGGPLERILPPRMLEKGDDPYPWPMFSSFPLPPCYLSEVPQSADVKQDSDIGKLLSCFKMSDKQTEWIENCRRQFCKTMKSKPDSVSGEALGELLEKFVLHLTENPSECYFPSVEYTATDTNVKNESLSAVQELGMKMTVRYGKFLNLLKDGAENDLALVLKHCERFLKQQQSSVTSSLHILEWIHAELSWNYTGHDWFVSSLFLIMLGDREKTFRFLQHFSRLLTSAFLWVPRLHISKYLPADTIETGIHPIYFCSTHYTEMLLKAEVPLVSSAFYMAGFAPSQICLQWITQCFWNYLDWIEICHYIATCVVLGPDYQVYICIAVLKHLQRDILQHTQTQDLQVFLKEEALRGFRVSNYFEYMETLEQNYRPVLLRDMRSIRVQST